MVGDAATAEWEGHDGEIAVYIAGGWNFISPVEGMSLFDKATGQNIYYSGGWAAAGNLDQPNGGAVIDQEARDSIRQILDILRAANLIPGI